jgi:hypothetical protein
MEQHVPTREEWGDLGIDLEVECAYKLFGGKTVNEAMPLFVENPIERTAELRFAAGAVFQYYIFCFAMHLMSPESADAADMASCFLRLVRDRASAEPTDVIKIWDQLGPVVTTVSKRQAFYDAGVSIYGSFLELKREIEAALKHA